MVELFETSYKEDFFKRIAPMQQDKVYELYQKLPPIVGKVIIFGSSTTSACNRYSDIDLLIVVPDKATYREALSNFLLDLSFDVDLLYWSEEDLKRNLASNSLLINNILRNGVKIYDRDATPCKA